MPAEGTATVHGARDHARSQAGAQAPSQPTIPATDATGLPQGVAPDDVVSDETFVAGGYASRVVRRGSRIRVTALEGDTNVSLVLHHAARPAERLNVADTVKLQWDAYPGPGSMLLSDMGRVLATVVDGDGPIDMFCGATTPAATVRVHGASGPWSPTPSGRELLILGLAKHGLTRRDLPPAINLFTEVRIDSEGELQRQLGGADPGSYITLRAELDLLVTLAVTPHPLDRRRAYLAGKVRVTAWRGQPAGPDDPERSRSPEARRAFENTDDVLTTLLGGAEHPLAVER